MASSLVYLLLSIGFTVLLWLFVFAVVWAIRSDLFGAKVKRLSKSERLRLAPAAGAVAATNSPSPRPATTRPPAPTEPNRPPKLVFREGPARGKQITLTTDVLTFGRSSDSSVVLTDDYTSSRHARLLRKGDHWVIEDLGSTNGTFLAGRRLDAPERLPFNTPVQIGSTVFELRA